MNEKELEQIFSQKYAQPSESESIVFQTETLAIQEVWWRVRCNPILKQNVAILNNSQANFYKWLFTFMNAF